MRVLPLGHARVDIVHHLLDKILSFLAVRRLSLSLHSNHLQTQFLPVPPWGKAGADSGGEEGVQWAGGKVTSHR